MMIVAYPGEDMFSCLLPQTDTFAFPKPNLFRIRAGPTEDSVKVMVGIHTEGYSLHPDHCSPDSDIARGVDRS
jgi:hypothetical protein